MSIEVPDNARGPILDLTLPASEPAINIVLRNKTTGKQLTLNLAEDWEGEDLSLDWRLRTITGASGVDRSALLDPEDNELWAAAEPFSGTVDVEVEASAPASALDDFENGDLVYGLTGKFAKIGGVYSALSGGDADDFNVSGNRVVRMAYGDIGSYGGLSGRAVGLNLDLADYQARIELGVSVVAEGGSNAVAGMLLRVVDNENFLAVRHPLGNTFLDLVKVVGGANELLGGGSVKLPWEAGVMRSLTVSVVGSQVKVWVGTADEERGQLVKTLEDSDLGGVLASGDTYLYDSNPDASVGPARFYDNFRVNPINAYSMGVNLRWEKGYY